MAENNIVNLSGEIEDAPRTPIVNTGGGGGGTPGPKPTFDQLFNQLASTTKPGGRASIPLNSFYIGDRYPTSMPGEDTEEAFAQQQSAASKFGNAIVKTAGTFSSSFLGGTAGLIYGTGKFLMPGGEHRLADIVDNEVNRASDDVNKALEDKFANYYTKEEQNSEWWSGTNLLSANFWGDKVLKNFGFAAGAIAGGFAWTKALRAIGLTNKLTEIGKGLEAATAIEESMAAVPNTQKYAAFNDTINSLAQKYLKNPAIKPLTNAERIVTSVTGAAGEGSIEAYQNMNDFRRKAMDEYVNTFGKQPEGADLENINQYSDKVANYTLGANMLLLSISNFIQLPKILGASRKAEKAMMNDISQKALGEAWTAVEKTGLKKGLARTANFLALGFAPSEAAEEAGQYAIQIGVNEFFNKSYRNRDDAQGVLSNIYGAMGDIYGEGVDKLFNTKEGMESLIIGGLSGGLQQARQEIKDRGVFGEGGTRKTNTDIAIASMGKTNIANVLTDQAKYVAISVGSQKARQNYIKNNDILNEKDSEFDYAMTYVMPRVKYGKEASVQQELDHYASQASTDKGYQELVDMGYANVNETRPQFLDKIAGMKELAQNVTDLNSSIKDKYGDMVTVDGKQKYSDLVIEKLVYAASKIDNYNKRIPLVSAPLAMQGIDVQGLLSSIITDNTTNKKATKEALATINSLDISPEDKVDLKTNLADAIELSLRRKIFIDEYSAMKKVPVLFDNEGGAPDINTPEGAPRVRQSFINEEGKKVYKVKELEVGKEYSLKQGFLREGNKLALAPKLKVLSTNLGNEYEVQLPTGEIEYMTPFQFKKYELTDADNASPRVAEILDDVITSVSRKAKYKALNIKNQVDKLKYINSLDNKELSDDVERLFNERFAEYAEEMAKSEYKREQLVNSGNQVEESQESFSSNSGDFPTGNEPDESIDPDISRKPDWNLFKSITLPSRFSKAYKGKGLPDFVTRYNTFINNVKNFKNRGNIRIMLVPGKFAEQYGLKGLAEIGYEGEPVTDAMLNDVEKGFVAAVFVEQDKGKTYLVDKEGKRIRGANGKDVIVGQPGADMSKIVFATMPTTSLFWDEFKDGNVPRYRVGEKESAERFAEGWKDYRNTLLNSPFDPSGSLTTFSFGISRGFPDRIAGKIQRNKIGAVLGIDDQTIAETNGLVEVSTKGGITHTDGQTYKFAEGRTVLKFGDVLEFLQNANFTDNQAKTIFQVLKKFSALVQEDIANNRNIQLKNQYTEFLQNVLFWKKSDKPARNQIFLDEKSGKLTIGSKQYDLIDIAEQEKEIVSDLKDVYFSVNSNTLKSSDKFYEFTMSNGELVEREWPNYQSYLLASSNPDGSARETPLTINVTPPSDAVPYAYEQKYAYMDLEFNMPAVAEPKINLTPSPAPTAPAPVTPLTYESSNEEIVKARMSQVITGRILAGLYGEVNAGDGIQREMPTTEGALIFTIDADNNINILPGESLDKMVANTDKVNKMRVDLGLTPSAAPAATPIVATPTPAPAPVATPVPTPDATPKNQKGGLAGRKNRFTGFKKVSPLDKAAGRISEEEVEFFKSWVAKNLPNMEYQFLQNMIKVRGGGEAWGKHVNGVISIVSKAVKGTEYHESYEYVEKGFLSPEEIAALNAEFRARPGTFVDMESGKTYAYNDPTVTDLMIKERRADDFAEFMAGKLPAKTLSEKLRRLFKAIMNFFSFAKNKSLQDKLFRDIASAKFADQVFPEERKDDVEGYKRVADITAVEAFEYVQDMKATFFQGIKATNASLFDMSEKDANAIFNVIAEDYLESGVPLSETQIQDLITLTKESLISSNIEFSETGEFTINDENVTSRNYAAEAFTVNFKKSAPYAVKLLTGSLVRMKKQRGKLEYAPSPITGGQQLIPPGEVYITLADKLANTREIEDVIAKLYDLARNNIDYVQLFQRLGGNMDTGRIDFNNYKTPDDYRLLTSFTDVFTKQKPEILVQYLRGNERFVGAASYSKASQAVENSWVNDIIASAGKENSIVVYKNKQYEVRDEVGPLLVAGTVDNNLGLLKLLGIDFGEDTYSKLTKDEKTAFGEAVQKVLLDIKSDKVVSFKKERGKTQRSIGTGLTRLAELYARVNSFNYDSTTVNSEGNLQQVFTDSNAPSLFEYYFNSVKTYDELLQKMPQLNDVFSKNSQTFAKGGTFFDNNGNRTKTQLNVKVVDGEIDMNKDKGQAISNLNIGTRTITEINQNVKGNYYVLIPADGSREWALTLGNTIPIANFKTGRWENDILAIFSGYLMDDIALAKDSPNRDYLTNMNGREKQLRFFQDFLKDTNPTMLKEINKMIADNASNEEVKTFIDKNAKGVRDAVLKYIENVTAKSIKSLEKTNDIIDLGEGNYRFEGLDANFAAKKGVNINKNNLSRNELESIMNFVNANYVINNIEMHKILFGDPFQFAVKTKGNKVILDITKRIKSFLSPRRFSVNFPELNNFYTSYRNTVGGIKLTSKDYGYHQYKDYLKTVTVSDINIAGALYGNKTLTNEADAQSWIAPTAYREVKDKNGQWSNEADAFHNWQMSYARNKLAAKNVYKYTNQALKAYDAELIKKPRPEYFTEELKPIVTGSKYGKKYIDLVLDKFSQMPIYYEAVEGTVLEDLFVKMFKENIDYVVVESGRKAGAQELHSLYKGNKLNPDKFSKASTVNVSWDSYGIQVENSYNAGNGTTLGSQPTKIATMDMYDNGKPISESAEAAVKEHTEALSAMYDNGVEIFMRDLGIIDIGNRYVIEDKSIVSKRLRAEMLKREMSENALASITINESTNDFDIPFESSTNYIEIKRILYSMIDKRISSPKVNGVSSVQVASTMWEKSGEGRSLARKVDGVYQKISQKEYEALSDKEKGEVVLTDSTLKMYDDGYCEVLIPFPSHLKGLFKGMTEKEVYKFLNDNLEEALTGVGFRIPTDALNKMERIKIAGFLPAFMGKTVVVPAEITTKAGSDFDIDKLNMYLKSLYKDAEGKIKVFQWKGSEEATKEFYADVFDSVISTKEKSLIDQLFRVSSSEFVDTQLEQNLSDKLTKLQEEKTTKEEFINNAYTRALENRYYSAIDGLLGLPENFDRLTAVTNTQDLIDLAEDIDGLLKDDESAILNRTLDRNYMTPLRNAFLTGKAWVGRVALHITGHSNGQKAGLFVDDDEFTLTLPHNTNEDGRVSVSGLTDSKGRYISDNLSQYINAIVDIAKDPYITKIIYSSEIVDVMMFLARAGVSVEDAAMFMQQPIIKEFVTKADNNKQKLNSLIVKPIALDDAMEDFPASAIAKQKVGSKYNVDNLSDNISAYINAPQDSVQKLSDEQNAEQQLILKEFVQMLKAANGLTELTQATTFDTTSFRSSEQLGVKQYRAENQMEIADPTVIKISSARAVLDTTHLGSLERALDKSNTALGTLLMFNNQDFREFIAELLETYTKNKYISKKNRDMISEKLSASLLDYIIQSKQDMLVSELTSGSKSAASLLEAAKGKHPELQILKDLQIVPGARKGAPETIRLSGKLDGAAEENMYTDMMRGLRDDPSTSELYDALIRLAIVQGTYRTSASIKNIIPIEDYAGIVTDLVKGVKLDDTFRPFKDNVLFQRNNFKDSTIVPQVMPFAKPIQTSFSIDEFSGEVTYNHFIPSIINDKIGRMVIKVSERTIGSGAELIMVPRVIEAGADKVDFQTGQTITPKQFAIASKQDDNPFTYVYGYQLVKADGKPLMNVPVNPKYPKEYIYKLVNLYGDGKFTFEYPTNGSKSLLENGTAKIETELTDDEVFAMLTGKLQETTNDVVDTSQPYSEDALRPEDPNIDPFAPVSQPTINIYAGTGENSELSNFAVRPFEDKTEWKGLTFKSVEGAYQAAKIQLSNMFDKDDNLTKEGDALLDKLQEASGAEAKALGRKVTGLNVREWDRVSSKVMKGLLLESFKQNPNALASLLATENAELTHTQDKGKWGTEFPRLLMEVRDELNATAPPITVVAKEVVTPVPTIQPRFEVFGNEVLYAENGALAQEYNSPEEAQEGLKQRLALDQLTQAQSTVSPIQQNYTDGQGDRKMQPQFAGKSTMDLILSGDRTRTTRAQTDINRMISDYSLTKIEDLVGKVIPMTDKSGRVVQTKITKVAKLTQEYQDATWQKEGWEKSVTDKLVGQYPYAIEFELVQPTQAPVVVAQEKNKFSYKGKTIDTAFDLTEGQVKALEELNDFVSDRNGSQFITLQGPAGTGKTSVIGYLQNYLGAGYKFHYMAPTHAATAELAFATVRTGNKSLPATVASSFSTRAKGGARVAAMTKKLTKKLALRNNIIVIDEVSMLGSESFNVVKDAIKGEQIKVIFMGDISQIPEVTSNNPDAKQVSKAFSEFKQVKLTEVKRTSDNNILKVLTAIRYNVNNKIPKVPNTDVLKYLKSSEFNLRLAESIENGPEETMLIAYTNNAVREFNKKIRQELGRTGDLQKDDVIIGYLGYSSKQIEKGDIANSIQYTVQNVEKDGSMYRITATSKKLANLREMGVEKIGESFTTGYYQLSPNDTFVFSDIKVSDMETNNTKVSSLMRSVYNAKSRAVSSGFASDWFTFYEILDEVSRYMSKIDLGDDYIYNPDTDRMEKYNADKHYQLKSKYSELSVEKGIDLGHAITIHKSQGSTIKNAFFDANSLPKGSSSKLYNGDVLVGSEKHSLIYVGMSRAANTLTVSDDNSENFYNLDDSMLDEPSFDLPAKLETSYMKINGKIYAYSEINPEMLEALEVSPEMIGDIMQKVNGC